MATGKTLALARQTFVDKVMSLLFNMLSRLVIAFLPRSKCLLISWMQSPSAVILEPKKMKCVTVSIVSPSICREVMGLDAMTFDLWMLSFQPAFKLSPFTFTRRLFSSSLLSAIRLMSSAYLRLLIFLLANSIRENEITCLLLNFICIFKYDEQSFLICCFYEQSGFYSTLAFISLSNMLSTYGN